MFFSPHSLIPRNTFFCRKEKKKKLMSLLKAHFHWTCFFFFFLSYHYYCSQSDCVCAHTNTSSFYLQSKQLRPLCGCRSPSVLRPVPSSSRSFLPVPFPLTNQPPRSLPSLPALRPVGLAAAATPHPSHRHRGFFRGTLAAGGELSK